MIDFHTHTLLSDGVLIPAEQVRRAYVAGYKVLGITDHVDFTNIEFVYNSLLNLIDKMQDSSWDIKVIPGVEITHVPAQKIEKAVQIAKDLKIPLIIVHGETPAEPVEKGTNRAAIESGVDILAHPGLILPEDVKRASELNINLEITVRKGHCITNGHVAKLANEFNAPMVLDTDSHQPSDFFTEEYRITVLKGCGLENEQIIKIEENIKNLSKILLKKMR
jgi:histidinol phosphatase-like PHP family hydrolase